MLDPDGQAQELRCNIEQFQFSAHASRESIVSYVKRLAPKKVVLVHGDPPAVEWVRTQIAAELPAAEVIVPTPGVEIEL
jgi:Cft2 family RNA processing exonuclease